ncbi:hypothetical protein E4N87_09500 [Treponema denticola]|uniref:Uncharacterized protein n=1 Tax=Treponema denticola TaxID=158 RepID=A0A9Q9BJQ0_TREDN|nr:hypothetical protein [Treponema denticola]UTC90904.1 hypothetical protein E4N87_09500 [Treponema denticola]UTC99744.1 hypothetical protein E4N86_03075 [Treponema denticola]
MINSSAGILPLCLSSSFVQSTKHRVVVCGLFTNRLNKLFSEIDSLSALADTMKNFLAEQNRKGLIFPAKSFYRRKR